jgi:hypothetical protein
MSALDDALAAVGIDLNALAPPDNYVRAAAAVLRGDFIGSTIDRVTVYSQYTKPVVYDATALRKSDAGGGAGTGQPESAPTVNPWGALFKPTVVVESPLRRTPYVFAPYGVADPNAYKQRQTLLVWGPIGVAALIAGSFFFLGRATKR